MTKPYVWVIEIKERNKWTPCANAFLTRSDARREKTDYWDYNWPLDKFRITKYTRGAIKMGYTTVHKLSQTDLDIAVNFLIVDGWEPIGGIAVCAWSNSFELYGNTGDYHADTCFMYSQAMIKRETK